MQDNADIDAALVQHISVTTQHFEELTARIVSEPPSPAPPPWSSSHTHVDGVKQEVLGLHSQTEFKMLSFFEKAKYFQREIEQSLGKVHTPVHGSELKTDVLGKLQDQIPQDVDLKFRQMGARFETEPNGVHKKLERFEGARGSVCTSVGTG